MTSGCEDHRAAISARADGEDPGMDPAELDAHLASCASCRAFAEQAAATRRRHAVGPAPEIPDLSRQVVRRSAAQDRSSVAWIVRWLLGLVAVEIVVLAAPDLFASGDGAHSARHLGAFGLAYAVGLLVVVVRPARARTMFHVALVLAAAMLVTALVDIAQGRVPLVNEALHIPELLSVLFLWILARPLPVVDGPADEIADDGPGATVRPLRRTADDA